MPILVGLLRLKRDLIKKGLRFTMSPCLQPSAEFESLPLIKKGYPEKHEQKAAGCGDRREPPFDQAQDRPFDYAQNRPVERVINVTFSTYSPVATASAAVFT